MKMPFKEIILERLEQRRLREEKPFEDLIKYCNKLFDLNELNSLSQNIGNIGGNKSVNTAVLEEKCNTLEVKLSVLRDELQAMHVLKDEQNTINNQLTINLKRKDKEIIDLNEKLTKAELTVNGLKAIREQLEKRLSTLESNNVLLKDEYDALKMAFNSLDSRNTQLLKDHESLVERYKILKEREIERLNSENAALMRKQDERLRKDLEFVSNAVVVDDSNLPSPSRGGYFSAVSFIPERSLLTFDAHEGEVNAMAWKNTEIFATGGGDRKVKLWQRCDQNVAIKQTLTGSNGSITSIDIEGDWLIASSNDFAIRVWQISDGKLRRTLTGHSSKVFTAKFVGAANKVVSGSQDRTLKIWDINKHACVTTLFAGSTCTDLVAPLSQDTFVISGHYDKQVRFWDVRSYQSANEVQLQEKITSLAISPDSSFLLCCVRDSTLNLLDLRMNKVITTFCDDHFKVGSDTTRACFSPDGRFVAAGSNDGSIFIWNQTTLKSEKILKEHHNSNVNCCLWDPKGQYFLSCDRSKKVVLWSN